MINIIAVGKTKNGFIADGIKEYDKRIQKYGKLVWHFIPDTKLTSSNNIEIVKKKEGIQILNKLKNFKQYKIALDEKGKMFTSKEFATFLQNMNFNVVFIIGGVYGLSDEVKQESDFIIGFSPMTFTHQMIRLILAEQIYRAHTIITGKKYHY